MSEKGDGDRSDVCNTAISIYIGVWVKTLRVSDAVVALNQQLFFLALAVVPAFGDKITGEPAKDCADPAGPCGRLMVRALMS